MKIYGRKGTISIPPAVKPLRLVNKNSALSKFMIKDKKRVRVLWLARVVKVKNPKRLVEIAKSVPEIDFYMAGGGVLLKNIKKTAPSNLKILGWQDAKLILPIADIFLSTSENEGMPIALIEAQLAGIPVIATNVGSISEVIINNTTGLLCNRSSAELIKAINKLAQNKKMRTKFGKIGKVNAIKLFSEKKLVSSHKNLYSKLK
jgi:glycosyltransferase involved in cell wall biosynthesis